MLKNNPFPIQAIKLSGTDRLYRLKVGDYRIIYEVNIHIRAVTVHYIRHRREVYRNM
ncbi:MAG: type II toxin-antitoxin system RelE/ParE family toxin [Planctomycetes bacterium]|nr:type II toxin-antitoxin system RelE/ParE family toxin [Planctomycetota bacterium]